VGAIVAGHTYERVAHVVEGIPIVQAGSLGQAFARVDLVVDRQTKRVVSARPLAPRRLCASEDPGTGACGPPGSGARQTYEGRDATRIRLRPASMQETFARGGLLVDAP
jgi:5'-nucleotidase